MAIVDGRTVAQNGIDVTQSFEISAASGPIGTPIELRVKGLGWRTMESTWVGELGQQHARLGIGGERARVGGRAVSRGGTCRAIT